MVHHRSCVILFYALYRCLTVSFSLVYSLVNCAFSLARPNHLPQRLVFRRLHCLPPLLAPIYPTMALGGAEIAKHDSRDSCWVIVHGKAYDVTDFLPEHPGGPKIILKYAGKDATEEYALIL